MLTAILDLTIVRNWKSLLIVEDERSIVYYIQKATTIVNLTSFFFFPKEFEVQWTFPDLMKGRQNCGFVPMDHHQLWYILKNTICESQQMKQSSQKEIPIHSTRECFVRPGSWVIKADRKHQPAISKGSKYPDWLHRTLFFFMFKCRSSIQVSELGSPQSWVLNIYIYFLVMEHWLIAGSLILTTLLLF